MRPDEVTRTALVTVIGAALVFIVQSLIYKYILVPTDVVVEVWIKERYAISAAIVFVVTVASQILWYYIATRYKGDEKEAESMRVPWLGLLILSLTSAVIGVYFAAYFSDGSSDPLKSGSSEAFVSLIVFFVIDVLILYWLATAISTPRGYLMYIVPGSLFLRRSLLRIR